MSVFVIFLYIFDSVSCLRWTKLCSCFCFSVFFILKRYWTLHGQKALLTLSKALSHLPLYFIFMCKKKKRLFCNVCSFMWHFCCLDKQMVALDDFSSKGPRGVRPFWKHRKSLWHSTFVNESRICFTHRAKVEYWGTFVRKNL